MSVFFDIAAKVPVDRSLRSGRQYGSEDQPQSRLIDLLPYDRSLRGTDLGVEDEAEDWLENAVAEIDHGTLGTVQ